MSLYGVLQTVYRSIVSKSIRHAIYVTSPLPLKKVRAHMIRTLEALAKHDEIYDEEYYISTVDRHMAKSCNVIAESIVSVFSPSSAIDVGCGSGLLLLALKELGIFCYGLDYSAAALDICRQRGLSVTKFDLEHDTLPFDCKADIAISAEAAEHLPESCADRFVDTLCHIADNIVITAAEPTPSYVGTDHVNEQPKEYWIEKFEARSFKFERDLTYRWSLEWKKNNVSPCYISGLMVFCKRENSSVAH